MTNSFPLKTSGLSHIAHERQRELRTRSQKLQAAELKVKELRDDLDRHFYWWHEDGSSITELSLASGVSRETVYRSIERVRADQAAGAKP